MKRIAFYLSLVLVVLSNLASCKKGTKELVYPHVQWQTLRSFGCSE